MSLLAFSCCEIGDCRIITPMSKQIETALQEAQSETTRYVLYNDVYNNRLVCVEGVALGLAFGVRLFYMLSTSKKNYARSGKGLMRPNRFLKNPVPPLPLLPVQSFLLFYQKEEPSTCSSANLSLEKMGTEYVWSSGSRPRRMLL